MESLELLVWSLIELVKFLLIVGGILNYKRRKKWGFKQVLWIVLAVIVIAFLFLYHQFCYENLFAFIIICVVFEEKLLLKVKGFLLSIIAINALDLFIWSLLINVIPQFEKVEWSEYPANLLGCVVWSVLSIVLKKKRELIYTYFTKLSFGWFAVIWLIFFGLGLMAGAIQLNLSKDLPPHVQRVLLSIYMADMLLVVAGSVAFTYATISKRSMEQFHQMEREKFFLQQKYYEGKLQQNGEIQKFRHDMKKHMKTIRLLCEQNKIAELQTYVADYISEYPEREIVYTGNVISDYFIGETIAQLSNCKDFQYSIMGKFPDQLGISDIDLCILLANALDNAKNAIMQVDGPSFLLIQIKNCGEHLMVCIENTKSVSLQEESICEGHGYGIGNMRTVVEKYNGTIEIIDEKTLFRVLIFI